MDWVSVSRIIGTTVIGILFSAGCSKAAQVRSMENRIGNLDERISYLERNSAATPSNFEMAASTMDLPTQPSASAVVDKSPWLKPTPYDIQLALKNAGFYRGNIDAKLGPKTHAALKEFQRVHGLKADGVVGRQTWDKLSQYVDGPAENQSAAETTPAPQK